MTQQGPGNTKLRFRDDPVKVYQGFNIARQTAIILASIILAKSAMTTENIGKYETLLYLGQFISLFWVSGLSQAFIAIYPKVADVEKKSFISSTFTIFLGLAFVSSLILIAGRPLLLPFLIESRTIDGFYWFCLYSMLNIPSMLIPSLLMLKGNSRELLRFSVFYAVGYTLVFALNMAFGGRLINLLILLNVFSFALLVMSGAMSLSLDLRSYRLKWVKRLFLIGSPLVGYAILNGLAPLFDSWLVQRFYTDKAVFAIYKYGAREFPLTVTLAIGLGTAHVPLLGRNPTSGMDQIKQRSQKLFPIVFITSALLILTSKYLFPIVFNRDFTSSAAIFNLYVLIIISRMIYPHTIMMGLKRTKALLYISIAEVFIHITASLLLGLKFGLVGIAGGAVIAFTLERLLQVVYLKWKKGIDIGQYVLVKPYVLYSLIVIIAWLVTIYL